MLFIRVDANEAIATGHLMRCLSIADAAKKQGEDTTFIMADEGMKTFVENRGYKTVILHTPWNDMEQEVGKLVAVIRENKIERLLVDSYQVTEKYLRALSKETKVAYIDDVDKFVYPVDTLICYAAYADKFDYPSKYPDIKLLLGTRYAPLRQEFCGLEKKTIHDKISKVLVLTGGADQLNVLQKILDVMVTFESIQVDAMCGVYNQNFDVLCERYAAQKNITLHRSASDIISYMKSADIAISAAGTTLYELCACGTPTISYVLADNQIDNAAWFAENHIIECAGNVQTDDVGNNLISIFSEYQECTHREKRSIQMQMIVDGCGAGKIAEHLII